MDEEERTQAFAKKNGVPHASFANKILRMQKGENLETLLPLAFAKANLVLPLFMDGETLAVAMADPGDAKLLDTIRLITGQPIQPFVSSKKQLLAAIDRAYGGSSKTGTFPR